MVFSSLFLNLLLIFRENLKKYQYFTLCLVGFVIEVQALEQDQATSTTTLITILITHAIFSHESGHTLAVLEGRSLTTLTRRGR